MIAKKNGKVYWSDIEKEMDHFSQIKIRDAQGLNKGNTKKTAKYFDLTLKDKLRFLWNNTKDPNSPYRYFNGVLYPVGLDKEGNIIYEFKQ